MIDPPRWTATELAAAIATAMENFRRERMEEPLEAYLEVFDEYRGKFEDLMETTVDLTRLPDVAEQIVSQDALLETTRYLAGPPISLDDLKVVAEVKRFSRRAFHGEPMIASRIIETVRMGLDRRRFPWVAEQREATEVERESAIVASAALAASQRVATNRRTEGKTRQENAVAECLAAAGFRRVDAPKCVPTLSDAPKPGEFCRETEFGSRRADLLVGLWDRRVMPIECKVSNSAVNSIKRVKNDAAAKAETWNIEFGRRNVVPTAVLSGVYDLRTLEGVQERGLTLFWAHELGSLNSWIELSRGN